jgi:hypothetical protein
MERCTTRGLRRALHCLGAAWPQTVRQNELNDASGLGPLSDQVEIRGINANKIEGGSL